MNPTPSRRDFLATSGTALGAWMALNLPAIEAAVAYARDARARRQQFRILSPVEARDLEAIAERIVPTDDTPGARDAGVVYFMDRALETFAANQLADVRAGLVDLLVRVRARHGATATFAGLSEPAQIEMLTEVEQSAFFGSVRFLTLAGMFADPSYGGNRDQVGWKLMGLEMQGSFQPPFGYYDREYGEAGR